MTSSNSFAHLIATSIGSPAKGNRYEFEFVTWIARIRSQLSQEEIGKLNFGGENSPEISERQVYFSESGWVTTPVLTSGQLSVDVPMNGPVIVETPFTSVVVDPAASICLGDDGALIVDPFLNS